MKPINSLLTLVLFLVFSSCNKDDINEQTPQEQFSNFNTSICTNLSCVSVMYWDSDADGYPDNQDNYPFDPTRH